MLNRSTDLQSYSIDALLEKTIDESDLVNRSAGALFLTGFLLTLVGSIVLEVQSGIRNSVIEMVFVGAASSLCTFIGLAIPLFASWGCVVAIGSRINWMFGKPLNPSAIAALAANVAFLVAFMLAEAVVSASSKIVLFGSGSCLVFLFFGSLWFQVAARVSVAKQIAHHNAMAGRKPYTEPPCHVQFRIRQMLILMFVVAFSLALLNQLLDKAALTGLMTVGGVIAAILATVFYPAILLSESFQKRFGKVRLKWWEQPRTLSNGLTGENADLAASERMQVESDEDARDEVVMPEPLISTQKNPESTTVSWLAGHGDAVSWISCSGSLFAIWLVVIVELSKAVHGENGFHAGGMFLVIPAGLVGLLLSFALAKVGLAILGALFGGLTRPGTLAAFAGGVIGALGGLLVVAIPELVHFNHLNGSLILGANNLFPIAVVLYSTLVGQAVGRIGIKTHGFRLGVAEEKYQAHATSPVGAASAWRVPLLVSVFCWCIFMTLSGMSDEFKLQLGGGEALLEVSVVLFACLFTIWPVANFLVRMVTMSFRRRYLNQPGSAKLTPASTL